MESVVSESFQLLLDSPTMGVLPGNGGGCGPLLRAHSRSPMAAPRQPRPTEGGNLRGCSLAPHWWVTYHKCRLLCHNYPGDLTQCRLVTSSLPPCLCPPLPKASSVSPPYYPVSPTLGIPPFISGPDLASWRGLGLDWRPFRPSLTGVYPHQPHVLATLKGSMSPHKSPVCPHPHFPQSQWQDD